VGDREEAIAITSGEGGVGSKAKVDVCLSCPVFISKVVAKSADPRAQIDICWIDRK